MTDKIIVLRAYYGSLLELISSLETDALFYVDEGFYADYQQIFCTISSNFSAVNIEHLSPDRVSKIKIGDHSGKPRRDHFIAKARQLKGILEYGANINDRIVEIGSLYNTITDQELRSRCGDLLVANDHFDRVVNQATQVLEDRIRQKSGVKKSGKILINDAVNTDLSRSVLILSTDPNTQEGYGNLLRGMMQTLRNESHHSFTSRFSREEAFTVCGFIDQLLHIVDRSTVRQVRD